VLIVEDEPSTCGQDAAAAAERAYGLGAVAYLSKACDFRAAASLVVGVLARFPSNDSGVAA
jgi:hypothetical protein